MSRVAPPCYQAAAVPDAPQLLVIRGVRAIDPSRALDATVDIVIEGGVITRVGPGAATSVAGSERARLIDGGGLWAVPAFVDLHAHLREPGQEYKEEIASGLNAAAAGGVRWNDPAFGIEWPREVSVIIDRDATYPDFKEA